MAIGIDNGVAVWRQTGEDFALGFATPCNEPKPARWAEERLLTNALSGRTKPAL